MSNHCPKGTVPATFWILDIGFWIASALIPNPKSAGVFFCLLALAPISPVGARSRSTAQIEAIRVEARGRRATLRVRASGPYRVVRSRLSDPERLVLDLSPVRWTGRPPVWSGRLIRTVRVAQHGPRRVRLVLDTGKRPTRWTGQFQGAEWVAHGRVEEIRRESRNRRVAERRAPRGSLRGLVIGIDPGHGGSDPGAISKCGLKEKDVTLNVAKRLRRLLQLQGARTLMTRRTDRRLPVATRKAFVAGSGADLIISIHCDALEGTPHCTGVTTYYHDGKRRSRELAQAIQKLLPGATGLPDRGARPDTSCYPESGFYVLRNATAPAVLIETGYISSAATAARLRNPGFRQQIARGIVDGLRQYVGSRPMRTARR
jgi:N-acetylmuramoyl-L-alanine amidase